MKVPLIVDGKPTWTKHTSDAVDAVLIPIDPVKFSANDIADVRVSDFPTPEEIRLVGIGEDIVSAGLVPGLSGKKRNYPFFKFGKVSNIPDELGVVPCGGQSKPANHWYVAATLIPVTAALPFFCSHPATRS